MRYILMANLDGSMREPLGSEEQATLTKRYVEFTQVLRDSGVLVDTQLLQREDTATTVRVRDGQALVTDGPFADITETLGGFWVVEAPDLDVALGYAKECPAAEVGSVEVRGVVDLPL